MADALYWLVYVADARAALAIIAGVLAIIALFCAAAAAVLMASVRARW